MKRLILLVTNLFYLSLNAVTPISATAPRLRILFDDLHGQSFGNADWTVEHAYSDFAGDIASFLDATVSSATECGNDTLSDGILDSMDCLVIPEPNIRFSDKEIIAIRRFICKGGGVFAIADHGGSDRNFDGWDSSLIFNELFQDTGLSFLGDTFTETPLRGNHGRQIQQGGSECESQIMRGVRQIAAWAATSIVIDPDRPDWSVMLSSQNTGLPFFICGSVGNGRVAAIGDSSAFDDGSGDMTKNRHSAYHSWLFDQQRLGIQTMAWLLRKQIETISDRETPFIDRNKRSAASPSSTHVIIDASRGNNDAGVMDRFGEDCQSSLDLPVALNLVDYVGLRRRDILILSNPDLSLSDSDVQELAQWISHGGRMILCGNSIRHPSADHGTLNGILSGIGSRIRFRPDQIVDETANTGSPWSLLITRFAPIPLFKNVDKAVFWSCASLTDLSGQRPVDSSSLRVIASSSPSAQSRSDRPEKVSQDSGFKETATEPDGFVVAVAEKIGAGTIVVTGANPFTNFQYPLETDYQHMDPVKWDHRTALFNLSVIRFLELSGMRKGSS